MNQHLVDCVLCGGFAAGNTGDELTLAVALRDMPRKFSNPAILSRSPEYSSWLYPQATVLAQTELPVAMRWKKFRKIIGAAGLGQQIHQRTYDRWVDRHLKLNPEWVQAVENSRLLYLVGGGYFTDIFSLPRLLLPVSIAKTMGVAVATAPLGIGPFLDPKQADLVASVLRGVDLCVRDDASLRFCVENHLTARRAEDDGFRVREILSPLSSESLPQDRGKKVGICLFFQQGGSLSQPAFDQWWLTFLRRLKGLIGENAIEGFCFHTTPASDFHQAIRMFRMAGISPVQVRQPEMDFRRAVAHLNSYGAVVTTRFHAAVVAAVFKIPCTAVASGEYYSNKMKLALGSRPFLSAISMENQPPESLADQVAVMRTMDQPVA